jgi:hypothetical protein
MSMICLSTAAGMDPQDKALAGEPNHGQHTAWHEAQAGRVPRLPPQAQTPQAGGQGQAGELLQHAADSPPSL